MKISFYIQMINQSVFTFFLLALEKNVYLMFSSNYFSSSIWAFLSVNVS